jgi:hypothetical protein
MYATRFFQNQSHEVRAAATETLSVLGFLFAADDIAFLRFFHTLLCRLTLEVDDTAGADSGAMLCDARSCSLQEPPHSSSSHSNNLIRFQTQK